MTLVKICGMMSGVDVSAASESDYLGFVVMSDSRRCLPTSKAKELMAATEQKKVMVTSLADVGGIVKLTDELRPDVVQAHSVFTPADMEKLRASIGCELWLLYPVREAVRYGELAAFKKCADKVVLDTPCALGGGSGMTHNWNVSAMAAVRLRPAGCVLAGGLDPDNVVAAIRAVGPDVVDVSSGVEVNGKKDAMSIKRFIENAKRC